MKASCVWWENEIELVDDEIEELRRHPLIGVIKRYYPGFQGERKDKIPLRIRIGRTDKNYAMQLHTAPGREFGEIGAYNLTISEEAYAELIERGMTGERLWSFCRIDIYRKGVQKY